LGYKSTILFSIRYFTDNPIKQFTCKIYFNVWLEKYFYIKYSTYKYFSMVVVMEDKIMVVKKEMVRSRAESQEFFLSWAIK